MPYTQQKNLDNQIRQISIIWLFASILVQPYASKKWSPRQTNTTDKYTLDVPYWTDFVLI